MFESYFFRRIAAKAVDLLGGFAIASLLSAFMSFIGVFAGAAFVLFADLAGGGQGIGKRFFSLRVSRVSSAGGGSINWRQSLLRNFLFALMILLSSVPVLGGLLLGLFGIPYCLFEIYLFVNIAHHYRLGDILSGTVVEELSTEDL